MYRTRFIIGLILIGVSLHFFAKITSSFIPFIQDAIPQVQQGKTLVKQAQKKHRPVAKKRSLWEEFKYQAKPTFATIKKISSKQVENLSRLSSKSKSKSEEPVILQIVDEEIPSSIQNAALDANVSAQIETILAQQQEKNAQLITEIEALFGHHAQREAMIVLTSGEKKSYQNAHTCRSLKQFLQRQQDIDRVTQTNLNKVFERYKSSFNYKSKSSSQDWNSFYQQVNNFRRAQD